MYKATVELVRIHHSLSIKMGIVLEENSYEKLQNKNMKWGTDEVVRKFSYHGNQYIRMNPRPFLTLDISNRKERRKSDVYDANYQMSMNQKGLFLLKKNLRALLLEFQSEKKLFYQYENGELVVDRVLAQNHEKIIPIGNDKIIILHPCVVQDEENRMQFYEGCYMAFNRPEYFTYLTYEEMEFFLDTLHHINLIDLAFHLMETESFYSTFKESGRGEEISFGTPIQQPADVSPDSGTKPVTGNQEIPNI